MISENEIKMQKQAVTITGSNGVVVTQKIGDAEGEQVLVVKKGEETNPKKMCVIVRYNGDRFIQKEVMALLLEYSAGRYDIESHISLSPSRDRHKDALFRVDAFCSWVLKECAIQHDAPSYIDEYLHAMVDKWHIPGLLRKRK